MNKDKNKNKSNDKKGIKKLFNKKGLFVIIAAVLVVGFIVRSKTGKSEDIESTTIKRGTVYDELILTGSVKAEEHANLIFQSSGELDWIGVSVGDRVKKGDALVKLDTTVLYNALMSAEADLRRYQASLDKTYDDVQGSENDESFSEIETRTISETSKDKAYRAYAIAQKNLANSTIRAPFDGIIADITNPFTGINTIYTQSQIEIINPDTIYFDVSADQSEVFDIVMGQKVFVVFDAISDEEIQGEVVYVGYTPKSADIGSFYEVRVKFLNDEIKQKLRVGMTGDAKFILDQKDNAFYLPPKYVNSDTSGKYLKRGRKNNKLYIEVGIEGEDRVEIISDQVDEGDIVFD